MSEETSPRASHSDRTVPTFSATLADGTLVEAVYKPEEHRTELCVARDGAWRLEPSLPVNGQTLVPCSPENNLLTNDVVLLPSGPAEYGSESELIAEIQAFIHRYVDVSPLFETMASYYVLLTWVYDAFNELPYLRVRGDAGSGKTRFLTTVGSLCYKPIFASGASTVSPIFRLLDVVRGTLIIDEGDFRASDEQAEVIKILNNGNARGFPVLRSEATGQREFTPTAYQVYGPKLVATRGFFEDRALETRCLTEETGHRRLRDDIPINAPATVKREALDLRNKLLLFRLRNLHKCRTRDDLVDRTIEPRLNQVFVPLLSVIEDPTAQADLMDLARRYHRDLVADRGQGMEAQILEAIRELIANQPIRPTIKEVATWFADQHGEEYERKVTARWIGSVVRSKLQLKTQRGIGGAFVIPASEDDKLQRLYEKYGLEQGEPDIHSNIQSKNPHPEPPFEHSELRERSWEGEPEDDGQKPASQLT